MDLVTEATLLCGICVHVCLISVSVSAWMHVHSMWIHFIAHIEMLCTDMLQLEKAVQSKQQFVGRSSLGCNCDQN